MRQSEFDKLSAALDRAEFAMEELRKKLDELHRKRDLAKTPEEISALNDGLTIDQARPPWERLSAEPASKRKKPRPEGQGASSH
jgi:hypothetical protein